MALTVAEVLDRLVEQVKTLDGFEESPFPAALLPADPERWGHLRFAIGLPETVFATELDSSPNRRPVGGRVETPYVVRFMVGVQIDDEARANFVRVLGHETRVIKALIATSRLGGLTVTVARAIRSATEDGRWFMVEIAGTCHHVYILEEPSAG